MLLTTQHDLNQVAKNYFGNLFNSYSDSFDEVLEVIHPSVSDMDNNMLTVPFHKDDSKEALYHIHPDKSPGPNGLHYAFHKKIFWSICVDEINSACCVWLNGGFV